jgi:hypothetical protein
VRGRRLGRDVVKTPEILLGLTPSPTLPARGRVFIEAVALSFSQARNGTSPLAGEVGRG